MKTKNNQFIFLAVIGLIVIVFIFFATNKNNDKTSLTVQPNEYVNLTIPEGKSKTSPDKTAEQLLYLIGEEKLAHDVYTVMYEKYGARVFGNILKSESTHQDKVLTLLNARDIEDPRSSEVGVYKNQELQQLYNQLINQGNSSETEAYKVGVIIEEKDIADINAQLATASEQDVIDTLEKLRAGSENHLRAFNRQL